MKYFFQISILNPHVCRIHKKGEFVKVFRKNLTCGHHGIVQVSRYIKRFVKNDLAIQHIRKQIKKSHVINLSFYNLNNRLKSKTVSLRRRPSKCSRVMLIFSRKYIFFLCSDEMAKTIIMWAYRDQISFFFFFKHKYELVVCWFLAQKIVSPRMHPTNTK